MKINPIRLSRLRNDTHFQFHTEFKDLAGKYEAYLLLYVRGQGEKFDYGRFA